MARPAKYPDSASRQAAYRSRVYWSQAPTQKFLAAMAEGLHRDLSEALGRGSCPPSRRDTRLSCRADLAEPARLCPVRRHGNRP